MKHLKYLRYVLKHKWFVFRAGLIVRSKGLPVSLWQLLIHDWSKFLPREWFPYADYFYGPEASLWIHQFEREAAFDGAWLYHQRVSPHHWQYWVLLEDSGDVKPLEMPHRYLGEMIADWMGAGMAIKGHSLAVATQETLFWFQDNRHKMKLHPTTEGFVEDFLILHQ